MLNSLDTPASTRKIAFRKHVSNALLLTALFALTMLMAGFKGCALTSQAKGQISNSRIEKDVKLVNGELDAGYNVFLTVTNVGNQGTIEIRPWLSCSEGEWSRHQNLIFKEDEAMKLSYFFHEPTISATNCQYGVDIFPIAK